MIKSPVVNRLTVRGKVTIEIDGKYMLHSDHERVTRGLLRLLENLCTTPEMQEVLYAEVKKLGVRMLEER